MTFTPVRMVDAKGKKADAQAAIDDVMVHIVYTDEREPVTERASIGYANFMVKRYHADHPYATVTIVD